MMSKRVPTIGGAALRWGSCWFIFLMATSVRSDDMQGTEGALWQTRGSGWNGGLRLEASTRNASFSEGEWDLDIRKLTARVGRRLGRAAHVWAEAGGAWADREGRGGAAVSEAVVEAGEGEEDREAVEPVEYSPWIEKDASGDPGLAWGVGGGVVLLQSILKESPVLGRLEWVQIELQASHRSARSDLPPVRRLFRDADTAQYAPGPGSNGEASGDEDAGEFTWADTRITPMLVYRRDRTADETLAPFEPTGVALRAGVGWIHTRMDYPGLTEVDEEGFGMELGADLRLSSGWIGRVEALFLDSSDRQIALSLFRYF